VANFRQSVDCGFSISPTSVAVVSAGASRTVAVTATSGCAWTAVSNAAFVTVTGNTSGTGSGTVGYSVAATTAMSQRIGTMTIAGQTFTVTQAAAGFTDDPLTAGTFIKAVHIMELRTRVNALRVGCFLGAFVVNDGEGAASDRAAHQPD
jgi:hypothetical protein